MDKDAQIKRLLALIEIEKHMPHKNKKLMKAWLSEIRHLRYEEDFRETYTGQDNKWQLHTSMRTWRDDC